MTPPGVSSTTRSPAAPPSPASPQAACVQRKSATRSPTCCAPPPRQMLGGILGAFVLMILFVGIGYAVTSIPSPNSVATRQSTLILYSNGKTLARLGDTNRTNVTLAQVPVDVQHAVLSAEDRSFESEPGISPTGILRALVVDLKGGEVQGGSTITQQYVKNAYLTQERTFTRKFKEIFIAVKL